MKAIKNIFGTTLLLVCGMIAFSCESETHETVDLTANVDIISFSIDGTKGTIDSDKQVITVMMPTGADLSHLSPVIEIPENAKVIPASGAATDFRYSAQTPVEYKVLNGNLYNAYKVIVKEIKAEITKFTVGDRSGIINQNDHTVLVYVPEDADLTQLIPVVEYTAGATITPTDGATVDFTQPVTYSLSYMGATFTYAVTVIAGNEPILPVTIYNGEDIVPQWAALACGGVDNRFANPQTGGVNATPYCASIIRNGADTDDGGKPWSGGALWNEYKVNIDPAVYNRFSLMVLKSVAGDVQLEIQSDGEQNKDWLKVWYSDEHLGEWQELIFHIPEGRTAVIN
ncbi:MAG: DUF5018 domain-containing protein, partial [Prevotellaceae bacterium]|nr:DUF5018 domain-containing protein [Prevotellaceae bacterium]